MEQWNATVALLNHYQTVLNQRFTWMTAIQGFIFTAFAIMINTAVKAANETTSNWVWIAIMVICLVGGAMPWLFIKAISSYGVRLQDVRGYWKSLGHDGFPPLEPEAVNNSILRLESLPILSTIAWAFALLFSIIAFWLTTAG